MHFFYGLLCKICQLVDINIKRDNIDNLIHDILNEKLFGFVEDLKLILKFLMNYIINFRKCRQCLKILLLIAVKKDIIGEHMFNYRPSNKIPLHKSKKLIDSMFGDLLLL